MNKKVEKEAFARTILDKIKLISNDKGGMYLLYKDLENLSVYAEGSDSSTTPK